MREIFLVGIGGGAGSALRFLIGRFVGPNNSFPWATLIVNVAGSFAIGLATGLLASRVSDNVRLGLVVGFLGGFTTFSAFTAETIELVRDGTATLGIANVAASLVLGIAAATAGLAIGKAVT